MTRVRGRAGVSRWSAIVAGALFLAACGGGDDGDAEPATTDAPSADTPAGDAAAGDDTVLDDSVSEEPAPQTAAGAPTGLLDPVGSFPIDDVAIASSLAIAPDGSSVAVAFQDGPGAPITLRLYDATSGDLVAETGVEGTGIGLLGWTTDGRIIAADTIDEVWRIWDATTLAGPSTAPYDLACGFGQFDPNTGFHYSFDGENLCWVDPATGTVERSADGLIVEPQPRFWLRAERGEVAIEHYPDPDPDSPAVLLTLDAATLEATDSTEIAFPDLVLAVGATTWLDDRERAVLEPGSIPAPDVSDIPNVSPGGAYFWTANGDDDVVFYDATDGEVVGAITAGLNATTFAGWSTGDAKVARLTRDGQVEVYELLG